MVSASGNFFGGEKVLLNLSEYFRSLDHNVEIIVPFEGEFTLEITKRNFKYHIIPIKNSFSIKAFYPFYRLVKDNNFDLIHSHGYVPNQISRIISQITDKPVVCLLHVIQDYNWENLGMKSFYYKILDRMTNALTSKIINVAVSKPVSNSAKYLKAEIIYNGVSNPDQSYDYPEKIKVFAMVGRIVNIKGIDTVLKAMKKLKDHDIKLLLYGDDITPKKKWKNKYIKYINENDLNVEMMGYIKDPQEIYSRFDVLIHASKEGHEGCPLVLIEAMIRKKLVIYSRINASKSVMKKNGIPFSTDDVTDLTDKIKEILTWEKTKIKNKIQADFDYANKRFSLNKFFKKHENIVKRLYAKKNIL